MQSPEHETSKEHHTDALASCYQQWEKGASNRRGSDSAGYSSSITLSDSKLSSFHKQVHPFSLNCSWRLKFSPNYVHKSQNGIWGLMKLKMYMPWTVLFTYLGVTPIDSNQNDPGSNFNSVIPVIISQPHLTGCRRDKWRGGTSTPTSFAPRRKGNIKMWEINKKTN